MAQFEDYENFLTLNIIILIYNTINEPFGSVVSSDENKADYKKNSTNKGIGQYFPSTLYIIYAYRIYFTASC